MRAYIAMTPAREHATAKQIAAGISLLLLVLVVGASAATPHGAYVAAALVGLIFVAAAVSLYVRDPVLALIGLWLYEIFSAPLSAVFGYSSSTGEAVRQSTELVVLLFFCLTVWRTVRFQIDLSRLRLVVLPLVGVALFGLFGAVIHGVPLTVTLVGAWLGLKLWLMLGTTLLLPWEADDVSRVYSIMIKVGLLVALLGFADSLTHGSVTNALHTSNYRGEVGGFRAEAVHSIFPHPGEYSLFMSILFAVAFARFAVKRNRSDLIFALLFAASIMLSLRLKGFLSIAAVALIVALVQAAASKRGAVAILLTGLLLVVGVYSLEGSVLSRQVSTYTSTEATVRARLYTTGEQIAGSGFPFGAGFGRYASYASRIYYSPIYYQYGLSGISGLSKTTPNYIDDTSWPSVIGETGYGGFALYVLGIIFIVVAMIMRMRTAHDGDTELMPLSVLCVLGALLVDSLGDNTLFSWLATTSFALVLAPALILAYVDVRRVASQPDSSSEEFSLKVAHA